MTPYANTLQERVEGLSYRGRILAPACAKKVSKSGQPQLFALIDDSEYISPSAMCIQWVLLQHFSLEPPIPSACVDSFCRITGVPGPFQGSALAWTRSRPTKEPE
jgi:hypothetical protein